jgi:hypothetical protein
MADLCDRSAPERFRTVMVEGRLESPVVLLRGIPDTARLLNRGDWI